jgi:hypothetical protein
MKSPLRRPLVRGGLGEALDLDTPQSHTRAAQIHEADPGLVMLDIEAGLDVAGHLGATYQVADFALTTK